MARIYLQLNLCDSVAGSWIIPIHYLKALSELLGMAGGHARAPLPQVTDAERATMRAELEKAGLLARLKQARAA